MRPQGNASRAARPRLVLVAAALGLALACLPAAAEATWRCGRRLVTIGDTAAEVLARCGAPSFLQATTELVTFRIAKHAEYTRVVPVERWTYDRGPHEFIRELTFRDGVLDDIAEGGYGG